MITFTKMSGFYIWISLFHLVVAREKNCTTSGHQCYSVEDGNPEPCMSGENVLEGPVCAGTNFSSPYCDYCPELHTAALKGPSYRVNETGCRQEDGFYRCQYRRPNDNCVRRTWLKRFEACYISTESADITLNCTDDEMKCRVNGRCVKRYDINSEFKCNTEPRKIYLRCHQEHEFECKLSKKCIPRHWVRDRSVDCSIYGEYKDTSDEDQPLLSWNPQTEFRCQDHNARCIPREMVMNGRPDCPDSSDEKQMLICLKNTEFRCELNGRCVRRYRVNDGFPDCPSGTDENVLDFKCTNQTEFDCGDRRCIPRSWVGNALLDCRSGIDERTTLRECFENEFRCVNGSRCLPKKYLCDGIRNCHDCSDEVELCDEPRRFRCMDVPSVCIPWARTCDGIHDCNDGSDERTHLLQGFKCQNHLKKCYVPQFMLETKLSMCTDSSNLCFDDIGLFICARCLDGKRIISRSQVCDGIIDCADLSDECPCQYRNENDMEKLCMDVFQISSINKFESIRNFTSIRRKTELICNGMVELKGGLDERFCETFTNESSPTPNYTQSIEHDYFCKNISEIYLRLASGATKQHFLNTYIKYSATKCNGVIECIYFDDECSDDCVNQPKPCQIFSERTWKISEHLEFTALACPNATNAFQTMIPHFICDGQENCVNGEDEKECPDRFYCNAGKSAAIVGGNKNVVSIEKTQQCDQKADCLDESDELNCPQTTHFYCRNKQPVFIPRLKVLDGHADCQDYSDECPLERFTSDPFSSPTELLRTLRLRIFIWIVAISSVVGNCYIIFITCKQLRKEPAKNAINYCNRFLVLNLAFADLLMGLCLCAIIVKSLQFSGRYCQHELEWKSSVLCDAIGISIVISTQTSLNILVVLTCFRLYFSIKPFASKAKLFKLSCVSVTFCWASSLFFSLYPIINNLPYELALIVEYSPYFKSPSISTESFRKHKAITELILAYNQSRMDYINLRNSKFSFNTVKIRSMLGYYSKDGVCFPNYFTNYGISLLIISWNCFATAFILVSYLIIYKFSRSKNNTQNQLSAKENVIMKKRIALLVTTNIISWTPIIVMSVINWNSHAPEQVSYAIAAIVFLPINSSLNPIIYSNMQRKVYIKVKQLLGFS